MLPLSSNTLDASWCASTEKISHSYVFVFFFPQTGIDQDCWCWWHTDTTWYWRHIFLAKSMYYVSINSQSNQIKLILFLCPRITIALLYNLYSERHLLSLDLHNNGFTKNFYSTLSTNTVDTLCYIQWFVDIKMLTLTFKLRS